MIYKIILNKNEIRIDEEERNFFINNQSNKFIELKSGEVINTAFVQGIIIDHEAGPNEIKGSNKKVVIINGMPTLLIE